MSQKTPQNSEYGHYLRHLGGARPEVPEDYFTPLAARTRTARKTVVEITSNGHSSPENQSSEVDAAPDCLIEQVLPLEQQHQEQQQPEHQQQQPEFPAQPHIVLLENTNMAHQIKMSPFLGNPGDSAQAWYVEYQTFCKFIHKMNEESILHTFPFHLQGLAREWFRSLSEENKANMDNVLRLFLDRFDGKDGSFSFGTIKQQHKESVTEFYTRFLSATNNKQLSEEILKTLFIDGLSSDLRTIVMPQHITSVNDARMAALRAERTIETSAPIVAAASPDYSNTLFEVVKDVADIKLQLNQALNQNQRYPNADFQQRPPNYSNNHYPRNNGQKRNTRNNHYKQQKHYSPQQGRNFPNSNHPDARSDFCAFCRKTHRPDNPCNDIQTALRLLNNDRHHSR